MSGVTKAAIYIAGFLVFLAVVALIASATLQST
jgi:hypothetical protein